MQVKASLKNLRTSPRKVRLVANSIVGMSASQALLQLSNTVKKTSTPMDKLLRSALANAENNFGLDKNNLFVESVLVGEGPRLKRWLPRAHGRATLILKRTSQIDLTLEEIVEGKNRKSKEQLEKERKEKEETRKKMIEEELKAMQGEEAQEEKEAEKTPVKKTAKKTETTKKAGGQESGILKKVFQRKSA